MSYLYGVLRIIYNAFYLLLAAIDSTVHSCLNITCTSTIAPLTIRRMMHL